MISYTNSVALTGMHLLANKRFNKEKLAAKLEESAGIIKSVYR